MYGYATFVPRQDYFDILSESSSQIISLFAALYRVGGLCADKKFYNGITSIREIRTVKMYIACNY